MAEAGHNTEKLLQIHVGQIQKAIAEKDAAVAKIRKLRKSAKADGINMKMLDRVLGDLKAKPDEREQDLSDYMRYARWLGQPIGFQADLFEDTGNGKVQPKGQGTDQSAAFLAGLRAGRMGEDQWTGPHPEHTPEGQDWLRGWAQGDDDRRQILAMKETEARDEDADDDGGDLDEGQQGDLEDRALDAEPVH
jgi:hypothetical protein